MDSKENTFVKVGFEFTAAPKPNLKTKNKGLEIIFSPFTPGDVLINKKRDDSKISKYTWINRNIEPDECGCEVPTPVIKNLNDVKKYYNQFMEFVNESDLTTDINKSYGGLGGCHIHLDLSYVGTKEKRAFLKNVAIFISNHPWLNWALNDPNDNVNANSLISRTNCRRVEESVVDLFPLHKSKDIKKAKTPLEIFLSNPLRYSLHKNFAIRYNRMYDTIEFRIFDMPDSLEQHLFHYNVAMAIYNTCLTITKADLKFKQDFIEEVDYAFLEERLVKRSLLATLKNLDLYPTEEQMEKMFLNIKLRYAWSYDENKELIKNNKIDSEDFYML